jgi:hypothetical protein
MALVTLQVIEGIEAGQEFIDLETPITIGREEDNDIRLNDERVSRFHAKIQDDNGRIILTDLESTNGTRVNGHPIRVRILRAGDQVTIGRCVLVYGSKSELGSEAESASSDDVQYPIESGATFQAQDVSASVEFPEAFPKGPPIPPLGLSPLHAAEVTDMLEYFRAEVMYSLHRIAEINRDADEVIVLPRYAWHRLQMVPARIARYIERISEPSHGEERS